VPFDDYLDKLELGNPIRKRVKDLYEVAKQI
jgi:hypothetical protein